MGRAAWENITVDSGGVWDYSSIALDSKGFPPHIGYYHTHSNLKYASRDGTAWVTEPVENDIAGYYASLALDSKGFPPHQLF
ncbi:hypothetical protein [Methanogenium cariaci]|uniref:hypothetical protein n=1 Tax=Methanogenium cariaci TaxID=2197 RepID=UPI0007817AB5|nr:hypothetical protein [Methanogenium cariaci]